jgi:hypothetical protein
MAYMLDPRLQALWDRQAIEHILTTYARAIDRLDVELLKSLYHPGALDTHASFKGSAEEFADFAIDYLRREFTATMHHITHSNINVYGDAAATESYFYAYHRFEGNFDRVSEFFGKAYAQRCRSDGTLDDGHEFICGGRYIDLFTKRNGEWRIADREITVEWNHVRPASKSEPGSFIANNTAPPGRDRDDIIYRFITRARKGAE